jgi:hypothetical protein
LGIAIIGGVNIPSITFYHLLKTFQVACPFVAINCANIFSFYNTTLSLPSSLDDSIFNSFKTSWNQSFKMSSWKEILK